MNSHLNIVWLKRDLRLQDHEPLFLAESRGLPYVLIYIFEPSAMGYPDFDQRHAQFVYGSILEMNENLQAMDAEVNMLFGEAEEVFLWLTKQFTVNEVFSYQESGIAATWERDKKVKRLLKEQGIYWTECQRDGIVRGIQNRNNWEKTWMQRINLPLFINTFNHVNSGSFSHPFPLATDLVDQWSNYPTVFQPPGSKNAWRYLRSFTEDRGRFYNKFISSPERSRQSCARLSPYLAWGNISIRQAYQFVRLHPNFSTNKRAFGGMLTRLVWHCHFIQKFEMEVEYETLCVNRGYESLSRTRNADWLEAWKKGQTGYPLVDANMRCVKETGWINFRMRALVVSFLCHHLDTDWREGVYHLAQQFLDYEPGIHYPQFQMQAGTTGVNTVRIYNPVKNSKERDPEGNFIRKWVPELANLSNEFLHEPWKMTALDQAFFNFELGKDYPYPIVDLEASGRVAREKIWGHRKDVMVQQEKQRILKRHVKS